MSTGTYTTFGTCGQSLISNVLIGMRPCYYEHNAIVFSISTRNGSVWTYLWTENFIEQIVETYPTTFYLEGDKAYDLLSLSTFTYLQSVTSNRKYEIHELEWFNVGSLDRILSLPDVLGLELDINGEYYLAPKCAEVVLGPCEDPSFAVDHNGMRYRVDVPASLNTIYEYNRETCEFLFKDYTSKRISSTHQVIMMQTKILLMSEINSFFFFPSLNPEPQPDLPMVKVFEPLRYFRRGGSLLWVPSNVDRKGESRNAYVERYLALRATYSRRMISLHLSVQRRIFLGNNSYPGYDAPLVAREYVVGPQKEKYCEVPKYKNCKAIWYKRTASMGFVVPNAGAAHFCLYKKIR